MKIKKAPRKRHKQRACGKVRYRDHAEAIGALRTLRDSRRDTVPARAYSCDRCGGYHLSSS